MEFSTLNGYKVKDKKAIRYYDSVADMKADTTLKSGMHVKTKGYYESSDSGSCDYVITSVVNSSANQESLNNNLYAEMIVKDSVNPVQFGCYGDGIHDDTTNLQSAITFCETNKLKLVSNGSKTYRITETLNVDTLICDFNNAIITSGENINLITINSTNYYGQLEKIKFDCTYANSGIYITNGRKKTFKDLIFENISNYGFYYNSGYEILLTSSHFKGDGTSGTVGIYANSSDSKFENIIMIDCQTAIVNKGLNFYNFIHAWILTSDIVENSIFFDIASNRCYLNQCYSDTYAKTLNCSGGQFNANQLEVFLNQNIWLETMSNPYVVYFTESTNRNIGNTITNSRLNGVRSTQHLKLSNYSISMIKLSNNAIVWLDDYIGIVYEDLTFSNNVTEVIQNKVSWQDGIVTVDVILKVDITQSLNVTSSNLPDYLRPLYPVNNNAQSSSSEWSVGINAYLYVGNNIQATLQNSEGYTYRYLKIHTSYKSGQYGNI